MARVPRARTPTACATTTTRTTPSDANPVVKPGAELGLRSVGQLDRGGERFSTAASTASARRASTRSRTTRCGSRTARTRARWARMLGRRAYTTIDRSKPTASVQLASGAGFVKDTKIPLRIDFADDVAGPFPANFLCFEVGGGPTNLCDASAGKIYGYNAACSVPGSAGKSTTFSCTADFGAIPDGTVWACVRAADASIPDNPNGSQPDRHRGQGQPVRSELRRRGRRSHRPDGGDRRGLRRGQGRRPRVVPGDRLGRHVGPGRRRPVDVGRQHRGAGAATPSRTRTRSPGRTRWR